MTTNADETTFEMIGISRSLWPGTWSQGPAGTYPIVVDREIRGTLHYVTGIEGDRFTNIFGTRLQYGMLAYLGNSYTITVDGVTYNRTAGSYYSYTRLPGDSDRSLQNSSIANNTEANWVLFVGGAGATGGVTGPTGATGRGVAFYYGTDTSTPLGPMPKPPQIGDLFLNTETGQLYVKNS